MRTLEQDLQHLIAVELDGVADAALRAELSGAIGSSSAGDALTSIADSFRRVTALAPGDPALRWYFRSWSMTNHSAMCVSGLGNRITMELRDGTPVDRAAMVQALISLHRICDEDLGVGTGLLHADLFYAMATRLSGDDEWQSKRFLTPEAQAFKQWKDRCNLIDADLLSGLLTTLVHEIYTHAEVEFLRPLFDGWLVDHDWSDDDRRRALLWIQVHCDGTELDHFAHATDALGSYIVGSGRRPATGAVRSVVDSYLAHKAAAMCSIVDRLEPAERRAAQSA
ncbi:MAG: hypothetical protein ACRDZ2_15305 [Ilumatobacteraceae bacterium]